MEKENKPLSEKETHWMKETNWVRTGEEDWECNEWTGQLGFETEDVKQAAKEACEELIYKYKMGATVTPLELSQTFKDKFGFEEE